MTRRDWWLGVAAVVFVVLLHALLPRYELRTQRMPLRFDRWTGRVEIAPGYRASWISRASTDESLRIIASEPLPSK